MPATTKPKISVPVSGLVFITLLHTADAFHKLAMVHLAEGNPVIDEDSLSGIQKAVIMGNAIAREFGLFDDEETV